MKTLIIAGVKDNSELAKATIEALEVDGVKVVFASEKNEEMNKRDIGALFAIATMGEAMLHSNYRHNPIYDQPTIIESKQKPIPKGCELFIIGKYEVVALNRKNAIRKALKLRAKK